MEKGARLPHHRLEAGGGARGVVPTAQVMAGVDRPPDSQFPFKPALWLGLVELHPVRALHKQGPQILAVKAIIEKLRDEGEKRHGALLCPLAESAPSW